MKITTNKTDYIITKASNNSDWFYSEFAIIEVKKLKEFIKHINNSGFNDLELRGTYSEFRWIGNFYAIMEELTEEDNFNNTPKEILEWYNNKETDWSYIEITEEEIEDLAVANDGSSEVFLEAYKVQYSKPFGLDYAAYTKYGGEEVYCEIPDIEL